MMHQEDQVTCGKWGCVGVVTSGISASVGFYLGMCHAKGLPINHEAFLMYGPAAAQAAIGTKVAYDYMSEMVPFFYRRKKEEYERSSPEKRASLKQPTSPKWWNYLLHILPRDPKELRSVPYPVGVVPGAVAGGASD